MNQQSSLPLFINEIGAPSIILLIITGLLFGIAFTYTHFLAIQKLVFKSSHFKKIIFFLTFIRLFVFASVLAIVAHPNHSGARIILFFIGFMIGRIGLMAIAKREFAK